MTDSERDARFDARLRALLDTETGDPAALSAAVLTRLASPAPARPAFFGWLTPGKAVAGYGGLLAAAVLTGYLGLPGLGAAPEEMMLTLALGDLMPGMF